MQNISSFDWPPCAAAISLLRSISVNGPTNYEIRFRRMIESRYAMQVTKETLLIDPTHYHSASSVDK
jgi:hypothetical protein